MSSQPPVRLREKGDSSWGGGVEARASAILQKWDIYSQRVNM